MPIGAFSEMREDARGLFVRGQLSRTQHASAVFEKLCCYEVSGLSAGFDIISSYATWAA
jgi:HK97 family phage prohead protease